MTDEERIAECESFATGDRMSVTRASVRWLLADWRRLKAELDNDEPIGQHCACRYDGERLLQECVPHAAMRRDAARWRWVRTQHWFYVTDESADQEIASGKVTD